MTKEHKQKIRESNKKTWADPKLRERVSIDRKGKNNPVHKPGVKEKISKSIKEKWQEGFYKSRINGKIIQKQGHKLSYRKYLGKFQDIKECYYCKEKKAVMIHHIDETQENWLLTNLIPICSSCHQLVYRWVKTPFIIIAKQFSFCSSHHLIEYKGKCQFNHGHQYYIKIYIKQRINPLTGMVMDYSTLNDIYKEFIDDIIDHRNLNEITIKKTTAENLLIWCWKQLEEKALLKGLYQIELQETDTSYAIMTVKNMIEYKFEEKDWIPLKLKDKITNEKWIWH